jgi:excisionase family DNA binding protein
VQALLAPICLLLAPEHETGPLDAVVVDTIQTRGALLRILRLLRIMRLEAKLSRGVIGMSGLVDGKRRNDDRDAELAQRAARRIVEYLSTHPGAGPVAINGELAGDDTLVVPREAAVLLAQVLGYLANGEGVTVIPDSAELTTQQAADFLNVSRPYLIKLLESGEIPFRHVGTHRRVRFRDLREFRNRDDLERRRAADELTQLSQDLGLY